MIDTNTKVGLFVVAILSILSGVRLLVDHFASGSVVGNILGKVVDFISGNIKHG